MPEALSDNLAMADAAEIGAVAQTLPQPQHHNGAALANGHSAQASAEATVFHLTHYKAGSQWVYAVLRALRQERVIVPQPGVQHVLGGPIVPGAIYATAYITRQQYELLDFPGPRRAFLVVRDLRDAIVSQYFSLKHSHPLISARVSRGRQRLSAMSKDDGLSHLIRNDRGSAVIQRSWLGTDVPLIRYEDLLENPLAGFEKIAEWSGIPVRRSDLARVVEACSFEAMSGRRPGQEDINSHQRKGVVGDWRNHLTDRLKEEFKLHHGDLLILYGYENDLDW